jgi:hypothetical protein
MANLLLGQYSQVSSDWDSEPLSPTKEILGNLFVTRGYGVEQAINQIIE